MKLPPLTLRNKLLGFAALLVCVPGVVIGVSAERSARTSLEQFIGAQLAREAGHTAHRLSGRLGGEVDLLMNFARQDVMREIRVQDIDKRIARALETLRQGDAQRRAYVLVDAGGGVIAGSPASVMKSPPAWRDCLRAADRVCSRPEGIVVRAPVSDPDTLGVRLGTLVGLLDWQLVTDVTESVTRDLAAQNLAVEIVVTDGAGNTLGQGEKPDAAWAELAKTIPEEDGYRTEAGLGQIVGHAWMKSSGVDWRVLITEPLSHAFAPVARMRRSIGLIMGVALLSGLAIAALASQRITRPLRELTEALSTLTLDDPAKLRVPVRTRDEVGELGAAFNHMAGELDRAQAELVDAEKFAFVGQLAAGVAHEVRTSLGVLKSSAQMLERSLPPDTGSQARELAGMIPAEANRLGRVVDDLLRLDRRRALHRVAQPLSAPVFRAAEFARAQAEEKGIRLCTHAARHEPSVLCDSEAIYEIALNLIVNAIAAVGEGGNIDVRISEPEQRRGGFVVEDDGVGVPDELREKIFQPFVSAREGGVGLGLTQVKRVVAEHQGRVSLESRVARGTCFRVELPLAEVTA